MVSGDFSRVVPRTVKRVATSWVWRRWKAPAPNRCCCSCRNRYDDREVEDRTSWKPEVPFMAGSLCEKTSHTAHTSRCYK